MDVNPTQPPQTLTVTKKGSGTYISNSALVHEETKLSFKSKQSSNLWL